MPNETEEIAIKLLKKRYGKTIRDVRGKGRGYDLKINNRRLIEVKSRRKNKESACPHIFMSKKEFNVFKNKKDAYLFVIHDLNSEPKLKILNYKKHKPKIIKTIRYQIRFDEKTWKSVKNIKL